MDNLDQPYVDHQISEIDVVSYTFENLGYEPTEEKISKRYQELEMYNSVIGAKLNKNCLKHYDGIEEGFVNNEIISSKVNKCTNLLKE